MHSTANDLLDLLGLPDSLLVRSAQTVPFSMTFRADGDTKYTTYQWLLCTTEFSKVTPLTHVPATLSYLGCSQAQTLPPVAQKTLSVPLMQFMAKRHALTASLGELIGSEECRLVGQRKFMDDMKVVLQHLLPPVAARVQPRLAWSSPKHPLNAGLKNLHQPKSSMANAYGLAALRITRSLRLQKICQTVLKSDCFWPVVITRLPTPRSW